MIRIGRQLSSSHTEGEVVCHDCGAAQSIVLWSVEPLNYAMPSGWTRFNVRGQLYSQRCPACTQRAQATLPAVLP